MSINRSTFYNSYRRYSEVGCDVQAVKQLICPPYFSQVDEVKSAAVEEWITAAWIKGAHTEFPKLWIKFVRVYYENSGM